MCYTDNMTEWEGYVQEVAVLIENREKYQRKLGEIAADVQAEQGSAALEGFAEDVKETTGRTISHKTLRNYAWVWNQTSHLELPLDITYRAQQALAGTPEPDKWFKKMIDEGWSSAELVLHIRKAKGLDVDKKRILCENCAKEIQTNKN